MRPFLYFIKEDWPKTEEDRKRLSRLLLCFVILVVGLVLSVSISIWWTLLALSIALLIYIRTFHGYRHQRRKLLFLFIAIALILVPLHWLLFQGIERVPGVVTRPLGPCEVDWYGKRGGIVAIGCPGMDDLKVRPLPVEQPWFEHLPIPQSEEVF